MLLGEGFLLFVTSRLCVLPSLLNGHIVCERKRTRLRYLLRHERRLLIRHFATREAFSFVTIICAQYCIDTTISAPTIMTTSFVSRNAIAIVKPTFCFTIDD